MFPMQWILVHYSNSVNHLFMKSHTIRLLLSITTTNSQGSDSNRQQQPGPYWTPKVIRLIADCCTLEYNYTQVKQLLLKMMIMKQQFSNLETADSSWLLCHIQERQTEKKLHCYYVHLKSNWVNQGRSLQNFNLLLTH